MRSRSILLILLLAMTGCVEWPDVETPFPSRAMTGWPELKPTASLPGPATTETEEERANATLQQRASALRGRAVLLRTPVSNQADFDRLRALLAQ